MARDDPLTITTQPAPRAAAHLPTAAVANLKHVHTNTVTVKATATKGKVRVLAKFANLILTVDPVDRTGKLGRVSLCRVRRFGQFIG